MDDYWLNGDFAVMKIDLRNAFNLVPRQAVLNAVNLHFPELLSWSTWCYGSITYTVAHSWFHYI